MQHCFHYSCFVRAVGTQTVTWDNWQHRSSETRGHLQVWRLQHISYQRTAPSHSRFVLRLTSGCSLASCLVSKCQKITIIYVQNLKKIFSLLLKQSKASDKKARTSEERISPRMATLEGWSKGGTETNQSNSECLNTREKSTYYFQISSCKFYMFLPRQAEHLRTGTWN